MEKPLIGIVGAGNMGSGIAQKYAGEGFSVTLLDTNAQSLELGRKKIETTLTEGIARRLFSAEQASGILDSIKFSTDTADLARADLVIEAIYENLAAKQTLFRELDGICKQETIFASNTSSFYISELASATMRSDRFVGLHYFYHPAKNRLVEVIKGKNTSQSTFDFAWQTQERIGKIAIESSDAPGFIVNRYFVPWLNEAMRIVEEGSANIPTVEAAAKQCFGCGMGPFELMNVTGVPITFHAATTLAERFGKFYSPSPLIRPLIEQSLSWDTSGPVDTGQIAFVGDRLMSVIFYVAVQLSCEEKVSNISDCDLGARIGLRWQRGPFELFNHVGIARAKMLVAELVGRHSDLSLPKTLTSKPEANFRVELISATTIDSVGILTFNRPDSLNALNEAMIQELDEKFADFEADPAIKGIVLTGRGKAFVAGADTKFFVDQIRQNKIDRIVDFASRGQQLFRKIDLCQKNVVCALNGMALGGGLELALACDFILCTEDARLGFPETSIGIYPGLGGTQRLPRRCTVEVAQWLILTGEMINANVALQIGIVDSVCSSVELISSAVQVAAGKGTKSTARLSTELQKTVTLFSEYLKLPSFVDIDALIEKSVQRHQRNAPVALKFARELISFSKSNDLENGLARETEQLREVFSTDDALIGLSSIGLHKPNFMGR